MSADTLPNKTQHQVAIPGVTVDFATLHQAQQYSSASSRHGRALLQQTGQFFSQYKGRGMDFAEVRSYQAGDDIRSIDWRVTARTGKAHTKLYHEERERPIWIVVDQSHSLFFGTQNCFKSVQACLIAAQLAWQAQQLGDRIGSLVFAESGQHYHLPAANRKSVQALFQFLVDYNQALTTQPIALPDSTSNQPAPAPLLRAIDTLIQHCAPGSFVVLISDFADFDTQLSTRLQQLAYKTQLLSYYMYDPLEAQLPQAKRRRQDYYIADGTEQLKLNLHDPQLCQTLANSFDSHFEQVKACIQRVGGQLVSCSTTESLLPCTQGHTA